MARRTDSNILMLPNGQVLVLGGDQARPQIWDPANNSWTDSTTSGLDPEPAVRAYHATAMLLPDARVLTGGESPSDAYLHVYCPPYLFNAQGGLASRPTLTSAPTSVGYGESFLIEP